MERHTVPPHPFAEGVYRRGGLHLVPRYSVGSTTSYHFIGRLERRRLLTDVVKISPQGDTVYNECAVFPN
jgi:hypothetical protein